MKKVAIIGGNAAGMSAASQVKRQKPDWEVIVYEKGPYISYGACGIPYYIQGLVSHLEDLITVTPADAVNKRKLNLKLNQIVTAIDPQKNLLSLIGPDGEHTDNFDYLVIATGASPVKAGIEYEPSNRIYTVHTLKDAENLFRFVEMNNPKNCAVIGGGYIALEMLEAFADRGIETHMFHRRSDLARSFEKEISQIAIDKIGQAGIKMHLNNAVTKISEDNNSVKLYAGNDTYSYDLVVVGAGVAPNSAIAKNCGIETGVKESIRVNEYMQTNFPHIYAAGDCAETKNLITGKPAYIPLALKANKEGVVAGVNVSGGSEVFPGVIGSAITKLFDLGIARTGLTLEEAKSNGFDAVKYQVDAKSRAHYYPGGGPLTAVLIAEKKEGRLLGAQMAGPLDAVKRIDVYATAITAEMTVDQIFQLDLAYAPPFSPAYDLVVLTGRVGKKMVR